MTPQQKTKSAASSRKRSGFSDVEKAAMKERATELRAERGKAGGAKVDKEADVLEAIAGMPDVDRELATRFHELVKDCAPDLTSKTWYGMPSYARDGKVVCFFQGAQKMETRYSTIGFSDEANLDEGSLWATSFALTAWNATNEKRIRALVKRAVS